MEAAKADVAKANIRMADCCGQDMMQKCEGQLIKLASGHGIVMISHISPLAQSDM